VWFGTVLVVDSVVVELLLTIFVFGCAAVEVVTDGGLTPFSPLGSGFDSRFVFDLLVVASERDLLRSRDELLRSLFRFRFELDVELDSFLLDEFEFEVDLGGVIWSDLIPPIAGGVKRDFLSERDLLVDLDFDLSRLCRS
jgi:hypothetical protein